MGRPTDVHAGDELRLGGTVEREHLDGGRVRSENVEVAAGRRISSSYPSTTRAQDLLLAPDGCGLAVDGGGTRRHGVRLYQGGQVNTITPRAAACKTYRNDATLQVPIKRNLADRVASHVNRVVVARLRAIRRPARRHLPRDRDGRTAPLPAQIHDRVTNAGVRNEERVLLRDRGERERDHAALRERDLAVLRGERAVRLHVPRREVARSGCGALEGCEQLAAVLAERDLADGAGRAVRGRGLVKAEVAERVRNLDEPELLVDGVAAAVRACELAGLGDGKGRETHLTPLIAPPLSTHRRLPSALKATEEGNSPSEDTGSPSGVMFVGLRGSILKRETVSEPAWEAH